MIDLYPVATAVVCGNCVLFDVEERSDDDDGSPTEKGLLERESETCLMGPIWAILKVILHRPNWMFSKQLGHFLDDCNQCYWHWKLQPRLACIDSDTTAR